MPPSSKYWFGNNTNVCKEWSKGKRKEGINTLNQFVPRYSWNIPKILIDKNQVPLYSRRHRLCKSVEGSKLS